MTNIVVRHSTVDEIVEIKNVYGGANAVAGTLQQPHVADYIWEDRLLKPAPGMYSLVAECDKKIAGHLGLMALQNPRRKHVGTFGMAVLDGFEGRGVGSALLGAAVEQADNWLNLSRIEITVFSDNESAIGLYKKYGFEVEGEADRFAFRHGAYVSALYMARLLPLAKT